MLNLIGRSALIAAAGLCLCISAPARAVEADSAAETTRSDSAGAPVVLKKFNKKSKTARRAQARKQVRAARSHQAGARKTDAGGKTQDTAVAPEKSEAGSTDVSAVTLPASVANANAQWIESPQTAADLAASGMSAQANSALRNAQADTASPTASQIVSDSSNVTESDQLNEIDRTLADASTAQPASITTAMAAPQDAPASATAAVAGDSTWNQTSLIGKIFIAFGGFLMLASAARMFIA